MGRVWSVEEQKEIVGKLGYDVSNWDPQNPEEVQKLRCLATNAFLKNVDARGKCLSFDEMAFLATITGL